MNGFGTMRSAKHSIGCWKAICLLQFYTISRDAGSLVVIVDAADRNEVASRVSVSSRKFCGFGLQCLVDFPGEQGLKLALY